MFKVFNKIDNLFNNIIKINTDNPLWANNRKKDSIPISNKYFLTIFDDNNTDIKNFFEYINDSTRTLTYPFEIKKNIDYSLMVEQEQFYKIDLENSNLKEISNDLDKFFKITNDSHGEIVFIVDINYLINNFINSKKVFSNHFVDFILWKLKNKISHIYVLDLNSSIKNYKNMLFIQLESCFINFDKSKYNLERNFLVYKNTNDDLLENIYWNLFYPEMKITEHIQKIKSPFDESFFNIVIINNNECFLSKINLVNIIDNNLLDINNNEPKIVIDPTDRINIFYE